jgi:hypothetical protein
MDIPLMLYIASVGRRNLPIPRWVRIVVICGFAATIAVKTTYDDQIRRLWRSGTTGRPTSACSPTIYATGCPGSECRPGR